MTLAKSQPGDRPRATSSSCRPARPRPPVDADRGGARAHRRGGARDRASRRAARPPPRGAALDPAAQPLRRPDQRDPGRAAARVARPGPRRRRRARRCAARSHARSPASRPACATRAERAAYGVSATSFAPRPSGSATIVVAPRGEGEGLGVEHRAGAAQRELDAARGVVAAALAASATGFEVLANFRPRTIVNDWPASTRSTVRPRTRFASRVQAQAARMSATRPRAPRHGRLARGARDGQRHVLAAAHRHLARGPGACRPRCAPTTVWMPGASPKRRWPARSAGGGAVRPSTASVKRAVPAMASKARTCAGAALAGAAARTSAAATARPAARRETLTGPIQAEVPHGVARGGAR